MKAQVFVSTREGAQFAIDHVKAAYATGKPHVVIIQEPVAQATGKQKTKAMTLISIIAQETGEENVRRLKHNMLNDMGWFDELVEELAPVPIGLTDLDKAQVSQLIDRLEQFMAENNWRTGD